MEALLARSSGMTAKAGRDGVNNALGRRDCRAAQGPGLALQCTECVRCVCLFCTIGECNITGNFIRSGLDITSGACDHDVIAIA